MKKFWIGMVVLVVAIVGFTLWSNKEATNQPTKTVRIGFVKVVGSLPLHIAYDQKFFEKNNVTVEKVELSSANQVIEALARGDIDGASFVSVFPLLSAELVDAGKMQIFSLSDMTSEHPFDAIMVNNNSPIKTLNDLGGKRIGVFPGSTGAAFLKVYLQSKGVDISKIEFVQLPPSNHLTALYASSIDALFSYEPAVTTGLQSGNVRAIANSIYADQFNHSPIASHILTTKFVNEYPQLAKNVVSAFDDANDYIENNNTNVREFILSFYGLPKNVADNVSLTKMSTYKNLDKNLFNKFVDYIVTLKELKSKPNLANIFYNK